MTENVILTMPQMVDLALGSPEIGAVNFNILHSLLHVLVQQVNLLNTQIEFRGNDGEKIKTLLSTAPAEPQLTLTEYAISSRTSCTKSKGGSEKELNVIEPRRDSAEAGKSLKSVPSGASASSKKRLRKDSIQKVIVVETNGPDKPRRRAVPLAVAHDKFVALQKTVKGLEDKIHQLEEIPSSDAICEMFSTPTETATSPMTGTWHLLCLGKRIEANEQGIEKLAGVIDNFVQELGANIDLLTSHKAEKKDEEEAPETAKQESPGEDRGSIGSKRSYITSIRERIEELENRIKTIENTKQTVSGDGPEDVSSPTGQAETEYSGMTAEQVGTQLTKEIKKLKADLEALGKLFADLRTGSPGSFPEEEAVAEEGSVAVPHSSFGNLNQLNEQIANMDAMFHTQFSHMQNQISSIEKELGVIVERLNSGLPGGDGFGQDAELGELFNKLGSLQTDIDNMNVTASKLAEDQEERQVHIDALIEQIELLKTVKANKEDLEDALADKADMQHVNRKVSHDQFDAACDDLSRGLEEALSKLTQQEAVWQGALDDLQREIGNKLDKVEITPLREFVTNKLKALQERLKALAALKKETDAAGTKVKLLKNVNCLSCDKDVVMRTELGHPPIPATAPLPPTRSMRPYLTYELDAVRKQQKRLPQGKNLHHFEQVMKEEARERSKSRERDDRSVADHLCNRYCGGSHTTTTPQQRVTRLGHFLTQWGPEAIPLSEGYTRGTDGQMYKVREATSPDAQSQATTADTQNVQLQLTKNTAEAAFFAPGSEAKGAEDARSVTGEGSPPGIIKQGSQTRQGSALQLKRKSGSAMEVRGSRTSQIKSPSKAGSKVSVVPSAGGDAAPPEPPAPAEESGGEAVPAAEPAPEAAAEEPAPEAATEGEAPAEEAPPPEPEAEAAA